MRMPTTSIWIGALAGVAVAAGVLWWRAGADERVDPRAGADTLRRASVAGLEEGEYRFQDPMRERTRVIVRDPRSAGLMQIHFPERPEAPLTAAESDLARHFLGDVEPFLRAYRAARPPVVEDGPFGPAVSLLWRKDGLNGSAVRQVWLDARTGRFLRLEERTAAGEVFRSVSFVRGTRPASVRPLPPPSAPSRQPALSSRTVADFGEFVRRIPLTIYEPATLPPGFARAEFAFDDRPPAHDVGGGRMPIAMVSYTDGMIRMNLFLAAPDQMRRLEELSRRTDAGPGAGVCPSTPAETPEDLLELSDAVLVRRVSDGCRTVLRRDDLPDVVVALVGFPGLPAEAYVRTIGSLVRVRPEPLGEQPLRPADEGR